MKKEIIVENGFNEKFDCRYEKFDDGTLRIFVTIDGHEYRAFVLRIDLSEHLIISLCMSFIYAYEAGKIEEQNHKACIFKNIFKRKNHASN